MTAACYTADPSDVVASSEASSGPLLSPPSNWPTSFKENKLLKSFMGKQLKGTRVRLIGVPTSDDAARVEHVALASDDSFGNAEAVQLALGWEIIKGFVVFELAETATFVAHKRWWSARPSGATTVWVDFTPRPEGISDAVLVESLLSTKERVLPTDERRAAAAARMALGGLVAPAGPPIAPPAAGPPVVTPPGTPSAGSGKPRPKPPSSPAKLAFSGSEALPELLTLLSRGTPEARRRAAARLAAQAASGPEESRRLVAGGALPPLLLLLREPQGELLDQAARALMSLADCPEHQQLLTAAGAVPAAAALLARGAPAVQETTAGILGNLAIQSAANQRAIAASGALGPLVGLLRGGATAAKEQACFALWNLACQSAPNQAAIALAGAVEPLVALLTKGGASLQAAAAAPAPPPPPRTLTRRRPALHRPAPRCAAPPCPASPCRVPRRHASPRLATPRHASPCRGRRRPRVR